MPGKYNSHPIVRIALALAALILGAWLSMDLPGPRGPVPFSGQSLALFISAAFLSRIQIVMAVTIYLMLGVAGCPVFAGGAAGLDTLTGGSGGFLIGFIFSGLFVSDRLYKKSDSSFGRVLQVMLVATFILFLFGLTRLTSMYDWSRAIDYGLKDFWIMALVKAVLAALTVKLIFFRQGRTKH